VVAMGGVGQGFIKDVPAYMMWETTFDQARFAQGAAIGVVLLILISILIIPYLTINLRQQEERSRPVLPPGIVPTLNGLACSFTLF
jgi:glucose/mannose transport system permease protein